MAKMEKKDMIQNVKNKELEALVELYLKERTSENLNKLVNHIRTCRVLIPANVDEQKKPQPCLISHAKSGVFLPVYTCQEQIPREPRSAGVLNMPFLSANKLVADQGEQIAGIVINPFSHNLIFKRALVERIEEVEKERKKAGTTKKVTMTQEQYLAFERRQFEFGHFPRTLFEKGREVIDGLCDRKEAYVDELFEAGYQQNRLYPYLTEDFSVMVMNISKELLVIRVDLPDKDFGIPSCRRIYLAWDETADAGRYLTIERTQDPEKNMLGEFLADGHHIDHGEAPVEGAELQRVIDLLSEQSVGRKDI
jgi:hypothetical protein